MSAIYLVNNPKSYYLKTYIMLLHVQRRLFSLKHVTKSDHQLRIQTSKNGFMRTGSETLVEELIDRK